MPEKASDMMPVAHVLDMLEVSSFEDNQSNSPRFSAESPRVQQTRIAHQPKETQMTKVMGRIKRIYLNPLIQRRRENDD